MPTQYYLLNQPAPYTPATIRGAWDQTAGAVTKALDANKIGGGINTSVGIAETSATNPFRVLLGRWISGPMAAQTISGTINTVLGILESNASADMNWYLHIYVTQGDSDTPRGTLLADYSEALGVNEWPTAGLGTFKALNAAASLSSLAISAGDRIVIEIGYVSREASATSRTGTLFYGTLLRPPQAPDPTPDGTLGSTNVSALAGFVTFSNSLTESTTTVDVRLSQAPIEVLTTTTSTADVRLSQVVLEVLSRNIPLVSDPTGGGTVPSGTEPAADISLCGVESPIIWIVMQTDAGVETYAKVDLGIDTVFREGRLISIDRSLRAMSDTEGRVETATTTIVISDFDRRLRGFVAGGVLLNKRVDVYGSSLAAIRLGSTPRRLASLVIRDYEPTGDLQFTLQCEDYFGSIVGEVKAKAMVGRAFGVFESQNDFPYLPTDLYGKAIPFWYGLMSDESSGTPTGIVPGIYVGPRRLSDGQDWLEFVICDHAVQQIMSWFASDLGETPVRTKMDPATEGTEFLIPGNAGWIAIVGANPYVEYNGNRYTVVYAIGARAEAARDGTIPLAFNVSTTEDVGDSTGDRIDSGPFQIQHFIANRVLRLYRTGSWGSIPSVNGYSRIDTPSFTTCDTIANARVAGGYVGAWGIGSDGVRKSASDAISQLCRDFDIDLCADRHGRVKASMIDNTTAVTKAFVDVHDIHEGSFKAKARMELLMNAPTFRYRRRYMSTEATNGPPGSFNSDWLVDGQWFYDTASIATNGGEVRTLDRSFWSVRDGATAVNVMSTLVARRIFPPQFATFTTDLPCGLDVDLGQYITVTHFAGIDSTGWTAKLLRVERMETNFDELTVTITGQVV